ncbi:DUF3558 family protein [Actinokineospora xionganensis]|uniref:DUF3558 family protein n=1 Tax=Actinokineospora xionganensis TaxID=2684470 RepID=A0ABR7L4C9_9PSEU|nr:DUF3558 family protein [Actinokineospora xionganensis]MBC6447202.1 DUF3558 family protein [Actinokineospora xionganensis]
MAGIIVRRSTLVLSCAVAALISIGGCTSPTSGTATPTGDVTSEPTSTGGSSTKTFKPTSSTKVPDSPLADARPCDLLTSSAASAIKVAGAGSDDEVGRGRICLWTIPAESLRDRANFTIAIFDTLGVKDIKAKGEVKTIPNIGKHEARQWVGIADNCVFSLAVGPSTRVDVLTSSASLEKSCAIAEQAAKLVEPELP